MTEAVSAFAKRQELLDVGAWSFILWCRLRGLQERMP